MRDEGAAGEPAEPVMRAAFDTVILAGGQSLRMGGTDKAALVVGNSPMLLSVAAAAAQAGTRRLIVVGPRRGLLTRSLLISGPAGREAAARRGGVASSPEVSEVREEPPGGGPVPALRRGLAEVSAPFLVLLAADLPFLSAALIGQLLISAASADGAVLSDDTGRLQWLAGCWRTEVLRTALARYGARSLHGLLGPLQPVPVRPLGRPAPGTAPWLDCDTPADLAAARQAWAAHFGDQNGNGE